MKFPRDYQCLEALLGFIHIAVLTPRTTQMAAPRRAQPNYPIVMPFEEPERIDHRSLLQRENRCARRIGSEIFLLIFHSKPLSEMCVQTDLEGDAAETAKDLAVNVLSADRLEDLELP